MSLQPLSSLQRILIVRVGAMGDVLHALPAVAALRHALPGAEITWVVDPRWAPLLQDAEGRAPVVSRTCLAETRLWSSKPLSVSTLRSIAGLRQHLRDSSFHAVIDLQGTLRSAVIGSFARGTRPAGFADPRERAAHLFYGRTFSRKGVHIVEQNAHLLGAAVGVRLDPAPPVLPRDRVAAAWADELLRTLPARQPLALLAPTAGWGAKQWPATHFGELAQILAAKGWTVLINAATAEDATCRAVAHASGSIARLVACSLPQLIALLRQTTLVVGGDSGPVHLAAALGKPLVALFGPTDPARNGPWGPGPMTVLRHVSSTTSYKRVGETEPGLAQLPVQEVFRAVCELVSLPALRQ